MQKYCRKCKVVTERNIKNKYCLACATLRDKKYYNKNIKYIKERASSHYKNNIEKIRARKVSYEKNNPEKKFARDQVAYAIKKGILRRASELQCNRCDTMAFDYHHHSYDKEDVLDVEALCRRCHINHHVN